MFGHAGWPWYNFTWLFFASQPYDPGRLTVARTKLMSDRDPSDAFIWLDENAEMSLESPDSAFDWVFMMTAHDWTLVESVWPNRSPLWREAFAYIVVDGPIDESREMLRRAVRDSNDNVAQQAAISLCHQHLEYPDDRIPIDVATVSVIRDLISRLGNDNMEPVPEFLAEVA